MMTTMMMMILSLFEPAHPHTDEGYSQKDESRIDIDEDGCDDEGDGGIDDNHDDDDDDDGESDGSYVPY